MNRPVSPLISRWRSQSVGSKCGGQHILRSVLSSHTLTQRHCAAPVASSTSIELRRKTRTTTDETKQKNARRPWSRSVAPPSLLLLLLLHLLLHLLLLRSSTVSTY